ncbi:hypothetical protein [Candidatus Protochlamydia phocaeensis]|uniref:hypothetical protein n=1 Tax=Candidatus Protochlamydia phocaeensis TaxID=1414722 RepID=UPI000839469C|nr:hypothetical protein [Candidatus Protochlamydia phocaeensis]
MNVNLSDLRLYDPRGILPKIGTKPDEVNLNRRAFALGMFSLATIGGLCVRMHGDSKYEWIGRLMVDWGTSSLKVSCTIENKNYSWLHSATNGALYAATNLVSSGVNKALGYTTNKVLGCATNPNVSNALTAGCMNMALKAIEGGMKKKLKPKELLAAGASSAGVSLVGSGINAIGGESASGIVIGGTFAGATTAILQRVADAALGESREDNILRDGLFGALNGGVNAIPSAHRISRLSKAAQSATNQASKPAPTSRTTASAIEQERLALAQEKAALDAKIAAYNQAKEDATEFVKSCVNVGYQDRARWRRGNEEQAILDILNGQKVSFRQGSFITSQEQAPISYPEQEVQNYLARLARFNQLSNSLNSPPPAPGLSQSSNPLPACNNKQSASRPLEREQPGYPFQLPGDRDEPSGDERGETVGENHVRQAGTDTPLEPGEGEKEAPENENPSRETRLKTSLDLDEREETIEDFDPIILQEQIASLVEEAEAEKWNERTSFFEEGEKDVQKEEYMELLQISPEEKADRQPILEDERPSNKPFLLADETEKSLPAVADAMKYKRKRNIAARIRKYRRELKSQDITQEQAIKIQEKIDKLAAKLENLKK